MTIARAAGSYDAIFSKTADHLRRFDAFSLYSTRSGGFPGPPAYLGHLCVRPPYQGPESKFGRSMKHPTASTRVLDYLGDQLP